MKKDFVKNIIVSFGGQLIVLLMGIIVPRILIVSYGSDVNGLLSTISQVFVYLALLEAGIGQAAKNLLYKPIAEGKQGEVSAVLAAARKDYRRISAVYAAAVAALAVMFPWIVHTDVEKWTVFLTVLIEGAAGVCAFSFLETDRLFLSVNGKNYINDYVDTAYKILSYSVRIVLAWRGVNIVFLQCAYLALTIGKILFYRSYYNLNYGWIDYSADTKGVYLKDRNAFILNEIAWTVFSSTDMIVISGLLSTKLSSVYSVYALVFTSINALLNAVYSAVSYSLGRTYHQDKRKYAVLHDAFQSVFLGMMTMLMCVTYWLMLPFVSCYTAGIHDVNYIVNSLPLMFCLVYLLSWTRYVPGNLTNIAGYAKIVSRFSLLEAAINVSLSIILAGKYGISGVLFATVAALPLKCVVTIYISERRIMCRSCKKTIGILLVNYSLFFGTAIAARLYPLAIDCWRKLFAYAVVLTIVYFFLTAFGNMAINRECLALLKDNILSNLRGKRDAG